MNRRRVLTFLTLALMPSMVLALPDGTRSLPRDLVVPRLPNGKSLPVTLYPSTLSHDEIYVKPLEGIFVGTKNIAISPTTSCDRVENEIKKLQRIDAVRNDILTAVEKNAAEQIKLDAQFNALTQKHHQFSQALKSAEAEKATLVERLEEAASDVTKAEQAISELNDRLAEANISGKSEDAERIQAEIDTKKQVYLKLVLERNKARRAVNTINDTLNSHRKRLNQTTAQLEGLNESLSNTRKRMNELEAHFDGEEQRINGALIAARTILARTCELKFRWRPASIWTHSKKKIPDTRFVFSPFVPEWSTSPFPSFETIPHFKPVKVSWSSTKNGTRYRGHSGPKPSFRPLPERKRGTTNNHPTCSPA